MSTESAPEWYGEAPQNLIPTVRRRRWPWVILTVAILGIAGGCAFYAWSNTDFILQYVARGSDVSSDDKAVLTDLLASQQKTSDDLAALNLLVAEQQKSLEAVSNQVAELASRFDALKASTAAATPPPSPAVVQPVQTARPVVASKPKKPAPPAKPNGPISIGGAPLKGTAE